MKRSGEEESEDDQEEAEMDVGDEEKAELEQKESDSDAKRRPEADRPFLDSFYGLSSSDPRERAQAAHDMIQYCLVGSSSNVKDADYALKRILRGLCSGRASARQGNASALSAFLKVAARAGSIAHLKQECRDEGASGVSDLGFVRDSLIGATEPSKADGTIKGSQDRDYKFGRLFGILGVVKSGILIPSNREGRSLEDCLDVSTAYLRDLIELYEYKKWMREPASHAIGTLLGSFYAVCKESRDSIKIVDRLVEQLVTDFLNVTGEPDDDRPAVARLSAEQIAVALNIQSHVKCHSKGLPVPLTDPVLTTESMNHVADALCETSSVTQPRTHLVWDAIIDYISIPVDDSSPIVRKMCEKCPVGDESVSDLLESIMRVLVANRLLGIGSSRKETAESQHKTTHERGALALCLVRNFCGVEFVSSMSGPTRLLLDVDTVENVVLRVPVVKALFLNTTSAGQTGQKHQAVHTLRPLAIEVLGSMAATVVENNPQISESRIAILRPLLTCDPRFDAKSKTNVISRLVESHNKLPESFWDEYVRFLEKRISMVAESHADDATENVSPYDAVGYLDLLFNASKLFLRNSSGILKGDFYDRSLLEVVSFLMATAFFDISNLKLDQLSFEPSKSKKKRKSTKRTPVSGSRPLSVIQEERTSPFPLAVRSMASARFYSLIAEWVVTLSHGSHDDKDQSVLNVLSNLLAGWETLESAGCAAWAKGGKDLALDEAKRVVRHLQEKVHRTVPGDFEMAQARMKCDRGLSMLSLALYLRLFKCDSGDAVDDTEYPDEDAISEDVVEFIGAVQEVSKLFEQRSEESEPIMALLALCADILSSQLAEGGQSVGAYPKLVRESVKMAWVGGLTATAAVSDSPVLDSAFIFTLLESIGAGPKDFEEAGDDSEPDGDESSNDSSSSGGNKGKAGVAVHAPDLLEKIETIDAGQGGESDSEDVEIDPDRLKSMLDEDSDASIEGGLEHHEGADAALSKLIQIKQEARKAGRLARQRLVYAQQLRCTILVELLVVGRIDGWGRLLSTDMCLAMILPIIQYRRELEKALEKNSESGSAGLSENRALLDRLTSLLRTKIFKMKHSDRPWKKEVDIANFGSDLTSQLLAEMTARVSKEHRSLCSLALTVVIKAIPNAKDKVVTASLYAGAVSEWSTRRTTRLESAMFDDLIQHCPAVAQCVLVKPLAECASHARTAFLKGEAFRLLALVFNPKLNKKRSDLEILAFGEMGSSMKLVFDAFQAAFHDDSDMKKAKRVKEVLKSMEKILEFVLASSLESISDATAQMSSLRSLVEEIRDSSDSQAVQAICKKVLVQIKDVLKQKLSPSGAKNPAPLGEPVDAEMDEDDSDEDKPSQRKKKSKKKKSKKRKK